MPAAIECQRVSLERSRHAGRTFNVLDNISAVFGVGSVNLISGPTGAGKTSLLHILAGLLRPTSGQVVVRGQPVSRWVEMHRSRWRRDVGIAFQHHNLFMDLTTLENALIPLVPCSGNISELRQKGRQALSDLNMAGMAGEKIFALSGGERQRVNLARAIVNNPQYIFVDEPTAHQDDENAAGIVKLLTRAKRRDVTVVIAAHDPRVEASEGIDAYYRLIGGKLESVK
jgi:ABC-type lipoprotein export system ATPase subunit